MDPLQEKYTRTSRVKVYHFLISSFENLNYGKSGRFKTEWVADFTEIHIIQLKQIKTSHQMPREDTL
ncbi:MAG: hypothetical protein IMZ60_03270 [Actinobacteria bacterium]|nr:hypothetical protein [Actinomycetota bacterium]